MRFKSIRGLQTDPEVTLDKAITIAGCTEAIREQQAVVGGGRQTTFAQESRQ